MPWDADILGVFRPGGSYLRKSKSVHGLNIFYLDCRLGKTFPPNKVEPKSTQWIMGWRSSYFIYRYRYRYRHRYRYRNRYRYIFVYIYVHKAWCICCLTTGRPEILESISGLPNRWSQTYVCIHMSVYVCIHINIYIYTNVYTLNVSYNIKKIHPSTGTYTWASTSLSQSCTIALVYPQWFLGGFCSQKSSPKWK